MARHRFIGPFLAAGMLLCLSALAGRAAESDSMVVQFGSVGGLTDAGILLGDALGYFSAAGVTVKARQVANAPTILTALATDQLDAAGLSIVPGLFNAILQGVQLHLVGDKQGTRPGFSAARLVVRTALDKGSEAATIAGLKGTTFAVTTKPSTTYMIFLNYLDLHGMKLSDLHVVELSVGDMVPAMAGGAIDGAIMVEPFLTQAIQMGLARQLSDLVEASGTTASEGVTMVPIVYSESFARRREPAIAFMVGYMRGVRAYNDAFAKGIDKEKIVAILAERTHVPAAIVRDSFPAGLDPNQHVSITALEAAQKFFVAQGYMRETVDVHKMVDPSFAAAAVAELGAYK
jgi:NitT/TauT family transport system substrate-binding protein